MNNKQPILTRYSDLLTEQDDPALLNLVEDLDTLYTSHQLPARLKRPVETNQSTVSEQLQPEAPLPSQPGTLVSFAARRHTRRPRLNALAAVLSAMLLVGGLLGTFYLAHRNGSATNNKHTRHNEGVSITNNDKPVCRAASTKQMPIGEIQMMTTTQGWARNWLFGGDIGNTLLHTGDGGCHWKIVTPPRHGVLSSTFSYISGSDAWAMLARSNEIVFARTTDGGQTWQFSSPVFSQNAAVQTSNTVTFLTPELGWLIDGAIYGGFTGCACSQITALYHTTDGGLTWKMVSDNLPSIGLYTGLSFLNSSTGWITGNPTNINITGKSIDWNTSLYVTHDGGLTWRAQALPPVPLAPGTREVSTEPPETYPPQFFSARDGVLVASLWAPYGSAVYVTHNGGETWQNSGFFSAPNHYNDIRTPIPTAPIQGPLPSIAFETVPVPWFLDEHFGMFWENPPLRSGNTLVTTHNAGQSWDLIQPSLPTSFKDSYPTSNHNSPVNGQVEFVSEQVGWLLLQLVGDNAPQSPILCETLDGGRTWTQLHYAVS